ncbi:thiamine phosphate synthase [uncultured Desulfobulbus sp.]|uniref:thiamine phosphate synthase n=1 Tax=uncultured Desulfobulbus sp. TaxID=239745 RepID=UPI0029C63862|nr:thiamine phosphate synthase [uncultured Desulfobulbus sp.]
MIDFSLYLVTDRGLSQGRTTIDIVRSAISGGVTCVQLREKQGSTREFIAEALAIRAMLDGLETRIPLIINDRIDVAMAIGADGVHLGQTDMHIRDARRLAGSSLFIGISVESVADAFRAEAEGADYIGVSPVFATPTKNDTALPLGLEGIRAIRAAVSLPLVGIGGIKVENAAEIIRAGADGVAVVSAIVSASCPQSAATALKQRIQSARKKD